MDEHGVGIERRQKLFENRLVECLNSVGGVDWECIQYRPDGASNAPLEDPELSDTINTYSYSILNIILYVLRAR